MTTSTEGLDRFTNSLTAELGIDTVSLLSAEKKERPFLGVEALATYAVYLFGIFVAAFLEELRNQIEGGAKALGKELAVELIKRVKGAVTKVEKTAQVNEEERRQAISTVDDALSEAASHSVDAATLQSAEHAGQAQIAAELKKIGMPNAEAEEKAERLMGKIRIAYKGAE